MGNTVARSHIRDADRGVAKATRINTRRNSAFPPPITTHQSTTPSPSNSSNMLVTPPPALVPSNPFAPTASPASSQASMYPESRHSYTYGCNELTLTRPDPPSDPPLPPRAVRQRPLDESGERVSQTKRRQRHASADIAFSRTMSAASSLQPDARSSRTNSSTFPPPVSADARMVREPARSRDRDDPSSLHRIPSHSSHQSPLPSPPPSHVRSALETIHDPTKPPDPLMPLSHPLADSPSSIAVSPPSSTRADRITTSHSNAGVHHAAVRIDPSLPGATVRDCQTARTQTPPRVDKPARARKVVSFNENVHIVTYPCEGSETYSSNSELPSVTQFPDLKQPKRRSRSVFKLLSRSSTTPEAQLEESDQFITNSLNAQYDPCCLVPLHPTTEVVYDHLTPANSASAESSDSPRQDPPLSIYESPERQSVIVAFKSSSRRNSSYLKATDSSEGAVLDDFDYTDRRGSENNETLSLSDAHLSCDGIDEPGAIVDQLLASREDHAMDVRTTSSFDITPLWQRLKRVDELDAVSVPRQLARAGLASSSNACAQRAVGGNVAPNPAWDKGILPISRSCRLVGKPHRFRKETSALEMSPSPPATGFPRSASESYRTKHLRSTHSSVSDLAAFAEPIFIPSTAPPKLIPSFPAIPGRQIRRTSIDNTAVPTVPTFNTGPSSSSEIAPDRQTESLKQLCRVEEMEAPEEMPPTFMESNSVAMPASVGSIADDARPLTPILRDSVGSLADDARPLTPKLRDSVGSLADDARPLTPKLRDSVGSLADDARPLTPKLRDSVGSLADDARPLTPKLRDPVRSIADDARPLTPKLRDPVRSIADDARPLTPKLRVPVRSIADDARPLTPKLRDPDPLQVDIGKYSIRVSSGLRAGSSADHGRRSIQAMLNANDQPFSADIYEHERPVTELLDGCTHVSSDIGDETSPSTVEDWVDARGVAVSFGADGCFVRSDNNSFPNSVSTHDRSIASDSVALSRESRRQALDRLGSEDTGNESLDEGCSLKTALQSERSLSGIPGVDLEEDHLGVTIGEDFENDGQLAPALDRARDRKLPSLGSIAAESSAKELSRRLLAVETENTLSGSRNSRSYDNIGPEGVAMSVSAAIQNLERVSDTEGSSILRRMESSEERKIISRKRRPFARTLSSRQSSTSTVASVGKDNTGYLGGSGHNVTNESNAAEDEVKICTLSDLEVADGRMSSHDEYSVTGGVESAFVPVAGVYYGTSSPSVVDQLSNETEGGTEGTSRYPEYEVLKDPVKEDSVFGSEPHTPELGEECDDWDSVSVAGEEILPESSDEEGRVFRRDADTTGDGRGEHIVPEVLLHEWSGATPIEPSVEMEDSASNSDASIERMVVLNHKLKEEEMVVKRSVRLSSAKLGVEISKLYMKVSGRDMSDDEDVAIDGRGSYLEEKAPSTAKSIRSGDSRGESSHLSSIRISTGARQSGHMDRQTDDRRRSAMEKHREEGRSFVDSKGQNTEAWVSSDYEDKERRQESSNGGGKEKDDSKMPYFSTLPKGFPVDQKLQDFQMNVERKSFSEIGYRRCGRGGASARGASFAEHEHRRGAEKSDGEKIVGEVRAPKDVKLESSKRRNLSQRRRRPSNAEAGGENGRDDGHAFRGVVGRLVSGMHMAKKLVSPN